MDARYPTLLASTLVESGRRLEVSLGLERSAELLEYHDHMARELRSEFAGQIHAREGGFLLLFERPVSALRYALAYHRGLGMLSYEARVGMHARIGIHLDPGAAGGGEEPGEPAGELVRRLCRLALGGQTLLTRHAFELARRDVLGSAPNRRSLRWLAHGSYVFSGGSPLQIFEVGLEDLAPLTAPPDRARVQRLLGEDDIPGWRPAPGQPIPRVPGWSLDRKLGEGSVGETWRVFHDVTREPRVFKFCYQTARLRALQREVTLLELSRQIAASRPGISPLRAWNFEEPPYYLATDYAAGGNLARGLEQRGGLEGLEVERCISLVARIAETLADAHSLGTLHKGLHPANIFFDSDDPDSWSVHLGDFGVGLMDERERKGRRQHRTYLAPEILNGEPPTVQADVYPLGVLLYQLLVGDLERPLAEGWEADIPDPLLREDIARATHRDPPERFDNARELARRLGSLEERRERTRAERQHRREKRLNRLLLELFEPPEPEGSLLRSLLDRARERLRRDLEAEPEEQAYLREALAYAYGRLELCGEAEALLVEAVEIRREAQGEGHPEVGAGLGRLGAMYLDQGDFDRAEPLLRHSIEIFERHPGEFGEALGEKLELLAGLYAGLGDHRRAEPLRQKARSLREPA